jgi:hypothetical protein
MPSIFAFFFFFPTITLYPQYWHILFSWVLRVFIYARYVFCEIWIAIISLFSSFLILSFAKQKCIILKKSNLPNFSFMDHASDIAKTSLTNPWFSSSGHLFLHLLEHKTFSIVTWGSGSAAVILWVETGDAAEHLPMCRTASCHKKLSSPKC